VFQRQASTAKQLVSMVNVNTDQLTAAKVELVEHGGRHDTRDGKQTVAPVGVTPTGGTEPRGPVTGYVHARATQAARRRTST